MKYFVESVLDIKTSTQKTATHFAICNGDKIRYLIALNNKCSRKRLSRNISTYSSKLSILMKLLCILPYPVLSMLKLGRFVSVNPAEQVNAVLADLKCCSWNVIVGSYVEKQKVVFQCFGVDMHKKAIYTKVGGETSEKEMLTETGYLEQPIKSSIFYSPKVIMSQFRKEGYTFNIQVTEEFVGERISPEITADVYQIFREIAAKKPLVQEDGMTMAFSHGDFTPWNIKKDGDRYVVFDWEYAGYRFYGFDLIHYLWQVENKLNKLPEHEAFVKAYQSVVALDKYIAGIQCDVLEEEYFEELRKQFGEVL